MSETINNLTKWINQAGESQRVVEFQYPYAQNFYVQIAFASKFRLNQIREACNEQFINRRTRVTEERMNEEKWRKEISERVIKGWRGLDIDKLNRLVPGVLEAAIGELKGKDIEEVKKIEVEYSQETAETILKNSIEFENWLFDQAINPENFSKIAEKKEKEYENLK